MAGWLSEAGANGLSLRAAFDARAPSFRSGARHPGTGAAPEGRGRGRCLTYDRFTPAKRMGSLGEGPHAGARAAREAKQPIQGLPGGTSSPWKRNQSSWNSRRSWLIRPGDTWNWRLRSVVRSLRAIARMRRRSRAVRVRSQAGKSIRNG